MSQIHPAALVVLAALLLACGNPSTDNAQGSASATTSPTDTLVERRDSAGAQIVTYRGSLQDLPVAFRIAETPTLDLGGRREDAAAELDTHYLEQTAARLSDGRYVVKDRDVIRVFGSDGKYLSSIGRRGEGPGEFQYLRGVCVGSGDTILAYGDRPVAAVFTPSGSLARTFSPPDGSAVWAGCGVDRSLLAVSNPSEDAASPPYLNAKLSLITADGANFGDLGVFPAGSMVTHAPAVASVVALEDHVFVGDGRASEVRSYRWDGSPLRILRWTGPPAQLTDDVLTKLIDSSIPTNAADRAERIARGVQRARASGPAAFPAYLTLLADPTGRLWIQDYSLGRGLYGEYPARWTVLDASGRPLGRVALPKLSNATTREELRWVGGDQVLLRWVDDAGFVHLSYHALEAVP
jgi:hypothetical protein